MTQLCPITLDPGNELVRSEKVLDQNRHACQRVLGIRKAIEPFPDRTFVLKAVQICIVSPVQFLHL